MAMPLGGRGSLAHRPVLLLETIELLAPECGGLFVDCTLGLGGHSEAILQASAETKVLGIDRDDEALGLAKTRLEQFGSRFSAVHADFRELTRVLATAKVKSARGQIVNLNVLDPTLQLFFAPGSGPPSFPLSLPVSFSSAFAASAQAFI